MFGNLFARAKCLLLMSAVILFFAGTAVADNISVNGANRSMTVYAPSGIEKGRPLIIQMHGMNQDAKYQRDAAKWESIADTARFIVVFPEGEGKSWDISGDKDVNFLKAIISEMDKKYGIDKNRVYVSGFSMGGMMSYHAANRMGDMIAAIAPCSGYPISNEAPASKRMMPIIHTHGTTDDVVNYNSAVSYLKKWTSYEKCATSQVTKPYPANKPGSAAYLEVWSGCDQSEIRLMSITGKGHWYSMDLASVNTSDEIWNFVKRFSLDGSDIAPAIQVPTNRDSVFNGGFDSSAVAWELQLHGDAAATGASVDGKYKLDITAVGAEAYTVQLIQHDLHLDKDQWYEVSFDASASAARTLEVNVEQHVDPWASYSGQKNFDLGTENKTFTLQFQMKETTDKDSRLSFNAGASTGTVYLDNVKIKKIDAPAVVEEPAGNADENGSAAGNDDDKGAANGEETSVISKSLLLKDAAHQSYSVYNLKGEFKGVVDLNGSTVSHALQTAGFQKGIYMLKTRDGKVRFMAKVAK
ncbi:carbohydrate binding domain-containing protein [Fibrobacter sp.]|uniref:carbohydrate binding domain-containing protein n=1 Tax=Fibrobacter sp. TaxID=35828 RepID=UPI003890CAD8